jgi:hypothetical protein
MTPRAGRRCHAGLGWSRRHQQLMQTTEILLCRNKRGAAAAACKFTQLFSLSFFVVLSVTCQHLGGKQTTKDSKEYWFYAVSDVFLRTRGSLRNIQ